MRRSGRYMIQDSARWSVDRNSRDRIRRSKPSPWCAHIAVGLDKLRPVNASEVLYSTSVSTWSKTVPVRFTASTTRICRYEVKKTILNGRPILRPNDPEEDETLAEEFVDKPSDARFGTDGTAEEPDVEEMPQS